jgi:hypothetical protein
VPGEKLTKTFKADSRVCISEPTFSTDIGMKPSGPATNMIVDLGSGVDIHDQNGRFRERKLDSAKDP